MGLTSTEKIVLGNRIKKLERMREMGLLKACTDIYRDEDGNEIPTHPVYDRLSEGTD